MKWEGAERTERMAEERGSFARAVTFLLRRGQEDTAVEVAASVWRLWVLARDYKGGRRFLAQILGMHKAGATKALALVLYGDSLFALRLGDVPGARKASEAAFRVARLVGDREALALATLALSRVAFEEGDYRVSLSRSSEARVLARGVGQAYQQAPLFLEASSRRMLRDYEQAASLFRESVELNGRIGDRGMVMAELSNLAFVEIHRDRADSAEEAFNESELLSPTPAGDLYGQGMVSLIKGMVAYRRGDMRRAKSLLSSARANFKRSGVQLGNDDKSEVDWLAQALKRVNA